MGFAADLAKLCAKAGDKAELVVRRTALELQAEMIERTPVDTGRAKGNWVASVGAMTGETSSREDKTPLGRHDSAGAIKEAAGRLKAWTPGQTIWLVNNLVYARKLELGHSKQAPHGMVRLAVQNYAEAVRKATESIK